MFGAEPGELGTMLPTSSSRITDVFDGADLWLAAQTFLDTPWASINSVIQQTHSQVLDDLNSRGMEGLAQQWNDYVKHIAPILVKRHKAVAAHAQHILEA